MSLSAANAWKIRIALYREGLRIRERRAALYAAAGRLTDESKALRADCEALFEEGDTVFGAVIREMYGNVPIGYIFRNGGYDWNVRGNIIFRWDDPPASAADAAPYIKAAAAAAKQVKKLIA